MTAAVLMLSVRPKYAYRILDGQKKFELRKTRPRIQEGGWILLYVSSPEKALKAVVCVGSVISGSPKSIWRTIGSACGITKGEYDTYFEEVETAYAIEINIVHELGTPVPLSSIRRVLPEFHPPQIYQYFEPAQITSLFSALSIKVNKNFSV